jgi:hypothetical protein
MEVISKKEKGIYLRFGDGDVCLANGIDDSLQKSNLFLMLELREAFGLNGPNVLKCLPLNCKEFNGYEEGMTDGNHERYFEWCKDILRQVTPIWNVEIEDVYSMTALAYAATNNIDLCVQFLQFLKKTKVCIFIGNSRIPISIRNLLFGPDCQFIPAPHEHSYAEIDRIERECIEKVRNIPGYKVIVTSMGCSGRALQYRLWTQLDEVFLFDFGSLMDAICGWDTRQWISLNSSHFPDRFIHILEKKLR